VGFRYLRPLCYSLLSLCSPDFIVFAWRTAHQLTPVPEDSACAAADADRYGNRCQGNGVAVAVGGDVSSVARGRSMTTARPPPVAKRSCLRQTTDNRNSAAAGGGVVSASDLELPRSPRRMDLQRLPARLRVGGDNAAATGDQEGNVNSNHNGNNDDTMPPATTTLATNFGHDDTEHLGAVDPNLFPLGVRLTTV